MLPRLCIGCILLIFAAMPATGRAAEPNLESQKQAAALLIDLGSPDYAVRERATAALKKLGRNPSLAGYLAIEYQRLLVAAETPLEVRKRVDVLRRGLPEMAFPPPGDVRAEEIDRLLAQLEDDDYGRRLSARKRLEWFLENPRLACSILVRLKGRLDAPAVSADARRWLEPLYLQTRKTWLASDPAQWQFPEVSGDQIAGWIADLVHPLDPAAGAQAEHVQRRAERELRDVLARDEYVERVRQALQARLDQAGLELGAAGRVRRLLDLTRPAMAAEVWQRLGPGARTQPMGAQHLIVGVPSLGPGAERASHFDRIDDQTAHCVSGQNLKPGDYPVGVAFPHPRQPTYFFHLVNLSTPRRKMAYEYVSETSSEQRLRDVSRRTFAWLLARKKPLASLEMNTVRMLDTDELSRFVGPFMEIVDDQPFDNDELRLLATAPLPTPGNLALPRHGRIGQPSHHALLCEMLLPFDGLPQTWPGQGLDIELDRAQVLKATGGTSEAVPGLLRAIERKRFLPPTAQSPYRLEWAAVLALAVREPGPEADRWLEAALFHRDSLVLAPNPPEIDATAAAALLKRRGRNPSDFDLQPVPEPLLEGAGVTGYRFALPQGREKVQRFLVQPKGTADGT